MKSFFIYGLMVLSLLACSTRDVMTNDGATADTAPSGGMMLASNETTPATAAAEPIVVEDMTAQREPMAEPANLGANSVGRAK